MVADPPCRLANRRINTLGLQDKSGLLVGELTCRYQNEIHEEEPSLYSIHTKLSFAIWQRAFLVQSPRGNLLWDCITLLDDDTIRAVHAAGEESAGPWGLPHE
jgi:hypothetical protein